MVVAMAMAMTSGKEFPDASDEEIKASFKALVKIWHPDKQKYGLSP